MKILNLSIEIIDSPKNTQSLFLSRRSDFVLRLSKLSEISQ